MHLKKIPGGTGRLRAAQVLDCNPPTAHTVRVGAAAENSFTIAPPTITNQPVSQTITAGETATFTVGGAAHTPAPGARPLGDGDVMVSYPLENGGTRYGRKTLTFSTQQIEVAVEHSGGFTELLPLAHASDAALNLTASRVELRRPDGAVFTVEVNSAGATLAVGSTSTLTTGLVRRLVTITGTGALAYQLTFAASSSGGSGGGANPPTPPAVVPSPSPGGGGGGGAPTGMGTLLLAALLALRSRRRQRAGAAATSSTAW